MSTAAQKIASIANGHASNGPTTNEGKANSSKNAVTNGLYASRDFIRPGEEAAYATLNDALETNLTPVGPVEQNLLTEIRRAMWRLNRCGEVEGALVAQLDESGPGYAPGSVHIKDPMQIDLTQFDLIQNENAARTQNSVDRARAQAHRLLHRCTSELRRLQTERQHKGEIFPEGTDLSQLGIADWRSITSRAASPRGDLHHGKIMAKGMNLPAGTPFTKGTRPAMVEIARNASCPCNSGQKYKRCCGRNAPAVLHAAA